MLETYLDMLINIVAIFMSYIFTVMIIKDNVVGLSEPLAIAFIFANVILLSFVYHAMGMYRTNRYMKPYHSLPVVLRANLVYFGIAAAICALIVRDDIKSFILIWYLLTAVLSTSFLTFKRHGIKVAIRVLRKKNYSLKRVIIIGDNTQTAADYIKQVQPNTNYGIVVLGYVGDKINPAVGAEKLGTFKELAKILDKYHPTDVVFAIDAYDKRHLIRLVNLCDDRCIKVYFLPVIYGFFKNSRQIEQVGSVPVINIHSTPLDNVANAIAKRFVDVVGSLALIILTSPLMLFAAIGVRLTSPGPILFKQTRVGRLGKKFTMLKFRSMRVNSGSRTTWTTNEDDRKTKFGTFLRRSAIDELPQLFNVLGGSMSLVGPRPELPHFVEHFKNDVPLYMVKHYVKPGITGLAQIKGLRGDTSVEDRIHEDIEYIENWTMLLDLYILLKTPFKAFNKNERYVDKKEDEGAKDAALMAESVQSTAEAAEPKEEKPLEPLTGKKILYVASTTDHLRAFHLDYITAMRSRGNDVITLANGEGADVDAPFAKRFFSKDNARARRIIKKTIIDEGIDVVLVHTTLAAFHVRLALPRKNRPRVVNVVHGYLFSSMSKAIKRTVLLSCEKLLARRTDALVVMNEEDMKIARRNRLTRGKIYFSRGMGVKQKLPIRDAATVRRELVSDGAYVLCFVGELSGRKNQRFLIAAMPRIKELIPTAKLWLVGDGGEREELEALARRLDVANEVVFLGRRSDVGDVVNSADVYVSASKSEGLPFNVVEAMALGKPVLASCTKGQEDVIRDGTDGILFDLGNPEEYVDKLKALHDGLIKLDPTEIINRSRTYTYDEVFDETLQIMMEACDERADYKPI